MFPQNTRILVIDDMSTMRKIIIKVLKDQKYTDIIEAADGNEGWKQLTESPNPVGLVVSDWNMPNCSGLELLKKVRGDSRFKNLPFLMVTAEAEQKQVIEALSAGVSNYIVKPFNPNSLIEKLGLVFKKHNKPAA